MRREHPFDATAGRPARSSVGGLANLTHTIDGDVCTGMTPGRAALAIDQPGGCHRIAEAGRQGVEPLIIEVSHNLVPEPVVDCSTSFVARPIKHIAEADHPPAGELIIAADLTATSKAGTVCRDFSKACSGSRTNVAKCPPTLPPM